MLCTKAGFEGFMFLLIQKIPKVCTLEKTASKGFTVTLSYDILIKSLK
jgi:hypothetical protein